MNASQAVTVKMRADLFNTSMKSRDAGPVRCSAWIGPPLTTVYRVILTAASDLSGQIGQKFGMASNTITFSDPQ